MVKFALTKQTLLFYFTKSFTSTNAIIRYTVRAKFDYLQLLLDVPFIFALLNFAKSSFKIDQDRSNLEKLSGRPKQKQKQEKEQQSAGGTTIDVEVVLNRPRIALLEDASEPNSRTMVLQVGVIFRG